MIVSVELFRADDKMTAQSRSLNICGWCCLSVLIVPLAVIVAAFLEAPVITPFSVEDLPNLRLESSTSQRSEDAGSKIESMPFGSGGMFDKIAFAYDIGNRVMSLGLDQSWRQTMINNCMSLKRGDTALDLATGTADVALLMGAKLLELGVPKTSAQSGVRQPSVFGVDPSREMLRHGVQKVQDAGLQDVIHLHYGDAQNLSRVESVMVGSNDAAASLQDLATGSVNKVSMAFGIRNVPNRDLALQEIARVLKKDKESRACILEFSLPDGSSALSRLAQVFIQKVIPLIGSIATLGRGGAEYRYLERSIAEFPAPKHFAAQMTSSGLRVQSITAFAFGSVQLYTAEVATVANTR